MTKTIENLIAYHCGPALAGIKPSNIVACYKENEPDVLKRVESLNAELNRKDIYLDVICECEKRVLIMAYRKNKLKAHLLSPDVSRFLSTYGYPETDDLSLVLDYLKSRMKQSEFPHEIGAFLGYPMHDIYGFINHKDEGCLLTGEWKVYKDVEKARDIFKRYRTCRECIMRRIKGGKTLAELFHAA